MTNKRSGQGAETKNAQLALPTIGKASEVAEKMPKAHAAAAASTMRRRRYKQGRNPQNALLLPPRVEDYVTQDNPVRAIKCFVQTLDINALGFKNGGGEFTAGQRAYAPADLLGLYLYGYLNRVQSGRRLEAECCRNLEVVWLLNGLRPGYHTITNFRKVNGKALKAVNKQFIALCRELDLFGGELIGIDGSFFNGDASHASVKTKQQLKTEQAAIEKDIERYHQALDSNDEAEAHRPTDKPISAEQLAALEEQVQTKARQIEQLENSGETQLSRTDRDARRLAKQGKKVTGYNVQTVVDSKFKLILTHEVTNAGNDLGQLAPMIKLAQQALAGEVGQDLKPPFQKRQRSPMEVVADTGYYTHADIAACETLGVTAYVPAPNKHSVAKADGRIPGSDFHYDVEQNVYCCPGGQPLTPEGKPHTKNGSLRQRYRSKASTCKACSLRENCLPKKTPTRQIYRSEHADAVERLKERMADASDKMRQRAALCEHPFGTMKRWFGWDHFLVRGFEKVRGEMALQVTCYNLRRLMTIFGIEGLIAICEERRHQSHEQSNGRGIWALFSLPIRLQQTLLSQFWRKSRFLCGFGQVSPGRLSVRLVAS